MGGRATPTAPASPVSTASPSCCSPSCRGTVPLVAVNAGYCFAGNAAILGCCDVVIATEDSNIGMGGPAMIEGGGLGVYEPTAVGPIEVQRANGVVDIVVPDEAAARACREAVPLVLPGPDRGVGVRRPGPAPRRRPARSAPQLRRATGDRPAVRHRQRARAPARLRHRHDHRPRPRRRSAGRRDRQQPRPPRRRDRQRRRRQGGALHAALRRVRDPDRHPVRHARDHGRARRRAHRPSCATAVDCSSTAPTCRFRS